MISGPVLGTSHSHQVCALCSDILTEAGASAGTWALATHDRVRDAFANFGPGDVELFITRVIDWLVLPETSHGERFKLAQICTMCRDHRTSTVDLVLRRYRVPVTELMESQTNDPLAEATRSLLRSLYVDHKDGRRSPIVAVTRPAVGTRAFFPSGRRVVSRSPVK